MQFDSATMTTKLETKLQNDGAPDILTASIVQQADRVRNGETGLLPSSAIEPVSGLPDLAGLASRHAAGIRELPRTVMIKLNGGLGTGMGMDKAKSLLPVKNGCSFLDLIIRQVLTIRGRYGVHLPLLMMNSFSTDADTKAVMDRTPELAAAQEGIPAGFLQHRVPKLDPQTLEPVDWPADPEKEWCPPGHGDIYTALAASGILDLLLEKNYRYAFVSNADNLGAVMEPSILGYLATQNLPFLMEVTRRTDADRKGGHLARDREGRLVLREVAQCPEDELENFQDIDIHRYFNTNNLWIDLSALRSHMKEAGGAPALPVIVNRKTIDPRDPSSPGVIQLETAMGTLISSFTDAAAVDVPRTRFSPVKTTNDLLALWSDAYVLTADMNVVLHPSRADGIPPDVQLDASFYKKIDDFMARFPEGAPSLVRCRRFKVDGDIRFGRHVICEGDVHLDHAGHEQIAVDQRYFAGRPSRFHFTIR